MVVVGGCWLVVVERGAGGRRSRRRADTQLKAEAPHVNVGNQHIDWNYLDY